MKRSEMVKIIERITKDEDKADLILMDIELFGMLPPSKKMDYKELQAVNHCVNDKFEYFHQWDKESDDE